MRIKIEFIDGSEKWVEGKIKETDDNSFILIHKNHDILEAHNKTHIKSIYYNVEVHK